MAASKVLLGLLVTAVLVAAYMSEVDAYHKKKHLYHKHRYKMIMILSFDDDPCNFW